MGQNKRLLELDIIKVLFLVFMPLNHVWCFFGNNSDVNNYESLYGWFIDGQASYGAAIFMFCMGMCFIFSRKQSSTDFLHRGVKLFIIAILLNVLRETVPYFLFARNVETSNLFPSSGYHELVQNFDLWFSIIGGDILVFAALAFFAFALFKYLKLKDIYIAIVSLVLYIAGLLLFPIVQDTWMVKVFPWFFDIEHCFIFTSWLPFVVLGYFFSRFIQSDYSKRARAYLWMGIIGVILLVTSLIIGLPYQDSNIVEAVFYSQYPFTIINTIAILFLFFSLVYLISKYIHSPRFTSFINHISSLLIYIYVIHWIILGWFVTILYSVGVDINTQSDGIAAIIGFSLIVVSWAAAHFYKKLKDKIKKRQVA